MGIKMTTPLAQIDAYIERKIEEHIDILVDYLASVGEDVVAHARSLPSPNPANLLKGKVVQRKTISHNVFKEGKRVAPHQPNYIDWSSNLRSSIGYVISVDGEIRRRSGFEPIKGGKDGAREGASYAESLVSEYPQGIALIVVAGKEYAAYVQRKGYDVLTSAELMARKMMNELFEQ
ncbi:MAG: hypothetical protein NC324_03080 [Bacteroides sp.]|nr:hypothetical protein [Bacteroides sp.]